MGLDKTSEMQQVKKLESSVMVQVLYYPTLLLGIKYKKH